MGCQTNRSIDFFLGFPPPRNFALVTICDFGFSSRKFNTQTQLRKLGVRESGVRLEANFDALVH